MKMCLCVSVCVLVCVHADICYTYIWSLVFVSLEVTEEHMEVRKKKTHKVSLPYRSTCV
jgi:hypothetical protein